MIKLLPCPNPECQSTDVQYSQGAMYRWWTVFCPKCFLRGPETKPDGDQEEARRLWNLLPRHADSKAAVAAAAQSRERCSELVAEVAVLKEVNDALQEENDALHRNMEQTVKLCDKQTERAEVLNTELKGAWDGQAVLQARIEALEGCVRRLRDAEAYGVDSDAVHEALLSEADALLAPAPSAPSEEEQQDE